MVERFTGSGRLKEGGFLATHKQDFNAHHTGGDFRHTADHIDMNPPVPEFPVANVQTTLEAISTFVDNLGGGFVTVGSSEADGYVAGTYNTGDPGTPTFRDALLTSFNDPRLVNGGIVLIMAGTHKLTTTVDVPAGISLMGEIAGTIITGEMPELPMFKLLRAIDFPSIGGDLGSGPIDADGVNPVDETRIFNLILSDDIDGYQGSVTTGNATMQTVPMIEIEVGSRVHIENVKFLGRVNNEAVAGRGKTLRAIGYSNISLNGSSLTLKRCFFDGMATAARFTPGNGDLDHLVVDQCRARTFGTEDISSALREDNCFVSMSLCNATLTDNHFIGFGTFPAQLINTYFVVSSATGGTDVSVVVSGNTGSPSSGVTSKRVYFDSTGTLNLKVAISGNNWGDLDPLITLVAGSAPATPNVGDQTIFVDSADKHVKTKDDAGLVTDLQVHQASDINYAGGPAWLGGRTNPAATVEAQLDKIITDLSDAATTDDGAERVGAEAHTSTGDGGPSLVAGSVRSQLNKLSDATHDTAQLLFLPANGAHNVETLSADKTLTLSDPHFQNLNGGSADRGVILPAVASSDGLWYKIRNTGTSNTLAIAGTGLSIGIRPGQHVTVIADGATWINTGVAPGSDRLNTTTIPAGDGGTVALDTTIAEVFVGSNNPGGNTIVELKKTTPTPATGRIIRWKRPGVTHSFTYTFKSGVAGSTIALDDTGVFNVTGITFMYSGTDWIVIAYTGAPGDFQSIT